ncbi:MAG: bifunctional riboflavin kinase/FAD synthetase [Tatlockia sp.]|jgi:riboflavin kinase/FMN adenylyltransferase
MRLLRETEGGAAFTRGSVATIGNFDGVHLGHQALLKALRKKADALGLPLVVILFEPQPGEYFLKEQAPVRLTSLREKLQVLAQCQVDYVYCLKFNARLASMPASQFAEQYFFSRMKIHYLLVGEDFRFGSRRLGDVALLKALGEKAGCQVATFPDFALEANRVSSTKIREALSSGSLALAAKLLGRPFALCGRVVKGKGLGRQWGIPTANLALRRLSLPLLGVFCVRVQRAGEWLHGVANLGNRPTVDGVNTLLEIHLFDFNEMIYGEMLRVQFVHKLRDEMKFSSIDALVAQIKEDISVAKRSFELIIE